MKKKELIQKLQNLDNDGEIIIVINGDFLGFNSIALEDIYDGGGDSITLWADSTINEAKMPKKYIGNDEIVFLKTKEDSRGANYNLYYKGHDIDKGGRRFGSEKELEDFASNYILSNQWYKKLKYENSIPLPKENNPSMKTIESIISEDFSRKNGWAVFNGNEIETIGIPSEFFDDESLSDEPIITIDKALKQAKELGFVVKERKTKDGKYVDAWEIVDYKGGSTYAEGGEVSGYYSSIHDFVERNNLEAEADKVFGEGWEADDDMEMIRELAGVNYDVGEIDYETERDHRDDDYIKVES
jgi:hypothetical protein